MGKVIVITGGARSGKSRYAVDLAGRLGARVVFVATCVPRDDEMRARVEEHRKGRPHDWETVERETEVSAAVGELPEDCDVVIVDCVTMLVSNLLLAGNTEGQILAEVQATQESLRHVSGTAIIVTNETGSGIVPDSELGRRFRDVAGKANQLLARGADEVYLMVSGIPVKIKEVE